MNTKADKTEQMLRELVECFVQYPFPQMCKHWGALRVLQTMDILGYNVPDELERAVIRADDETALEILQKEQ